MGFMADKGGGRTAVYRLYDRYGSLLYVGITGDPDRRFRQHAADKDWWPAVASHEVDWYARRCDAEAAEEAAIKVNVPPFNKEHSPEWPMVSVTIHMTPALVRALDLLSRLGPPKPAGWSQADVREAMVGTLVEREIAARGLGGGRPCFHTGIGWPDGLEMSVARDGICPCGNRVSPDGRFPSPEPVGEGDRVSLLGLMEGTVVAVEDDELAVPVNRASPSGVSWS